MEPAVVPLAAAAALLPNLAQGPHGDILPPGVDEGEFQQQEQEQEEAVGQGHAQVPPQPPHVHQHPHYVPPHFWQPPLPGQPPVPPYFPPQFYPPQFYPPWMYAQPHVQPPQLPPPAQPHKVKLPMLWANDVASWFALAESSFDQFNVVDSLARFNLILPALDCETREHVRAVTHKRDTLPDPYTTLKERLLQLYKLDIWEGVRI